METRRGLLKKTLGGAALLAAAGAVPVALRKTRLRQPPPGRKLLFFTPAEYSVLAAVADRLLALAPGDVQAGPADWPGGFAVVSPELAAEVQALPAPPAPAEVDVAGKIDAFLAPLDEASAQDFKQLLALFDNGLFSLLGGGPPAPFTAQTPAQQDAHLARWANSRLAIQRTGYQAMKRLCCAVYFGSPETYASVGYPGPPVELVQSVLAARKAAGQGGAR